MERWWVFFNFTLVKLFCRPSCDKNTNTFNQGQENSTWNTIHADISCLVMVKFKYRFLVGIFACKILTFSLITGLRIYINISLHINHYVVWSSLNSMISMAYKVPITVGMTVASVQTPLMLLYHIRFLTNYTEITWKKSPANYAKEEVNE